MSEQPVAIVIAAGSGIGAACARMLASQGYKLVLMSRSNASGALAAEIDGLSFQGSVTVEDDLKSVVELAMKSFGRIDVAVNNTGHASWSVDPTGRRYDPAAASHLLDIPDEDWHSNFDLYFMHVVRMARLITPLMQKQGGGSIVNISAFAAAEPFWGIPSSSIIRRALSGFTKLYADRYARDGIRMNNVLPGYLDNWEWTQNLVDSIPAGRAGTLDELANLVAFLLSKQAGYITGQDILMDGGLNRSI